MHLVNLLLSATDNIITHFVIHKCSIWYLVFIACGISCQLTNYLTNTRNNAVIFLPLKQDPCELCVPKPPYGIDTTAMVN